jgi:hypothetical protein
MSSRIFPKVLLILGIFASLILLNSCMGMMGMGGHGGHSMSSGHDMQSNNSGDTTLIRNGIIDVESIDVNKDGFVYQDQMDWNAMSDNPGKCPLCGMELQKVGIEKAKENLKKNGFNVKQ